MAMPFFYSINTARVLTRSQISVIKMVTISHVPWTYTLLCQQFFIPLRNSLPGAEPGNRVNRFPERSLY